MNRIRLFLGPAQLAYVSPGSQINATLVLVPGSYSAYFEATDNCGNVSTWPTPFTVVQNTAASGGGTGTGASSSPGSGVAPALLVNGPVAGGSYTSPVRFAAAASTSCAAGMSRIRLFTGPAQLAYVSAGGVLDTSLMLSPGSYSAMFEATDNCGAVSTQAVAFTVAGNSASNSGAGNTNTSGVQDASGSSTNAPNANLPVVAILSPAISGPMSSPVHFAASASTSCPSGVSALRLFTGPAQLAYFSSGAALDATLPLVAGSYNVTVEAVDNCGATGKSSLLLTVGAPAVSVAITPAAASVTSLGVVPFQASVSNAGNTAVTWNASGGTVSPSGLYTAPSVPGSYLVTATSVADPTKTAQAVVTVSAPAVSVSITPSSAALASGSGQQFLALVTGSPDTRVNWSVSSGAISSSGFYIAPATAGTFEVRATSVANPAASASAQVQVTPVVAVRLAPATAAVVPGGTIQFSAAVTGTPVPGIAWFAERGTISPAGLYTAPMAPGNYKITATSLADPSKSAAVTVSVVSALVSWNPSLAAISGYRVYRSLQSGGPYALIGFAGPQSTSFRDLNLAAGKTHYYVVTTIDASGTESEYSAEASATAP